jgi:hypothetical protein
MFKVGDKVRCIEDVGVLTEGGIYTVREPYEGDTLKGSRGEFVYVDGDKRGLGGYYPDHFELVSKPAPQAAAIAGGLQEHSVGEYYPLAAVMYEHNGERIITIENLQTGEVAALCDSATNWRNFGVAYDSIERIQKGEKVAWSKGRVSYVDGRWVVAEPANPVRVTRLRNMLHRG